MVKLYIAYGSNLNLEQMANRCPTAKVVGTSEIKDHNVWIETEYLTMCGNNKVTC